MASNHSIAGPRLLSHTSGAVAGVTLPQTADAPAVYPLAVLTLRIRALTLVALIVEHLREVARSILAHQGYSRSGNSPLRGLLTSAWGQMRAGGDCDRVRLPLNYGHVRPPLERSHLCH